MARQNDIGLTTADMLNLEIAAARDKAPPPRSLSTCCRLWCGEAGGRTHCRRRRCLIVLPTEVGQALEKLRQNTWRQEKDLRGGNGDGAEATPMGAVCAGTQCMCGRSYCCHKPVGKTAPELRIDMAWCLSAKGR